MERSMDKRRRRLVTLAALAIVAVGLYGFTLLRFGAMLKDAG